MTVITKSRIPTEWQKGMIRATERGIKATRLKGCRCYRVNSGSGNGCYTIHIISGGKVGPCQCEASRRFGPEYVCSHRGAVAMAVLFFQSVVVREERVAA